MLARDDSMEIVDVYPPPPFMLEPFAKTFPLVAILTAVAVFIGWWLRGVTSSSARPENPKSGGAKGEKSKPAGGVARRVVAEGVAPVPPSHSGTRVILHIGMPKSGTTALQHTLRANRELLLRHGIIYPAGGGLPVNHNILVVPFLAAEKLPRIFRQVYEGKPERRLEDVRQVIQRVAELARAKRAHTVILSGEMLFKALTPENVEQLRSMLLSIGDRITVVAYVRHPAKFYLSMAQQAIKASSQMPEPKGRPFRKVLDSYAGVGDEMIVNAYDRDLLHAGDITQDFCKKVLGFNDSLLEELAPVQTNETVTAEGMDILLHYRKYACKNKNGVFTMDTNLLGKVIREVDPGIPNFGRPVLHPEIAERIVRSAVDLPWLRDTWNIEFPDVDYDAPFKVEAKPLNPRKISDICYFNAERRDRLLFRVLEELFKNQGVGEVSFKTAMPEDKA